MQAVGHGRRMGKSSVGGTGDMTPFGWVLPFQQEVIAICLLVEGAVMFAAGRAYQKGRGNK